MKKKIMKKRSPFFGEGGVDADMVITDRNELKDVQAAFDNPANSPSSLKSLIQVGTRMSGLSAFDLTGKTALVTGSKRGIGRGMAEALAQAGADIIAVSASLETTGSEIEKAVTAMGRQCTAYQVDFSDREALLSFTTELQSQGIVPDILVNNAGTIKRKPAAEHPDEWWDEVIEVKPIRAICLKQRNWQSHGC